MPKTLLTINDVIQATGLSRSKIYQEINSKRLSAVKVGRRTFVPSASLGAWVETLEPYLKKDSKND